MNSDWNSHPAANRWRCWWWKKPGRATNMNLIKLLSRGLVVSLALLTASAGWADEVDDYVETQRQWLHIPGLSLAVVKDGKIIKAQGYGLANVETETRATPESVFKI